MESHGWRIFFLNIFHRQYRLFQNVLRDAGLMQQEEIDYNMEIIAESLRWLKTHGEVVNDWLLENFS